MIGAIAPAVRERRVLRVAAVTVFLVAWELVGRAGVVDPIFLSYPSMIARAGHRMLVSGELVEHLRVSGAEFLLGLVLACVTGLPIGLLAGRYPRIDAVLDPFLSGLYATPRLALLPLIVLWIGIGLSSKVAIVFLGAFFPICLDTIAGVRAVDPRYLRLARSFRASEARIFRTIVLPSAAPFIVAGLRLAVGRALVGVVVGEFFAGSAGIGFLISVAGSTFQTDKVFVGIVILAAVGIGANAILSGLAQRIERWRPARGPG